MKYIKEFLEMKCAGDILNYSYPIKNTAKEITEGMAIKTILKDITLSKKNYYKIFELCAGNALPAIISAFTLPIKKAVAIDKLERKRKFELINKFKYKNYDINEIRPQYFQKNDIIIGMHSCKNLAKTTISLYNDSEAEYLILCPCCQSKRVSDFDFADIKQYDAYTIYLASKIKHSKIKIKKDKQIMSSKNNLIIARKNYDI